MTAKTIITVNDEYKVEGSGYKPVGKIKKNDKEIKLTDERLLERLVQCIRPCNDSSLDRITHNQNKKVAAHAHGNKGIKIALQSSCDSIEHGTDLKNEDTDLMRKNNIFLIPTLSYGTHIKKLKAKSGLPDFIIKKNNRQFIA